MPRQFEEEEPTGMHRPPRRQTMPLGSPVDTPAPVLTKRTNIRLDIVAAGLVVGALVYFGWEARGMVWRLEQVEKQVTQGQNVAVSRSDLDSLEGRITKSISGATPKKFLMTCKSAALRAALRSGSPDFTCPAVPVAGDGP
jgi:hypothetical protein